MAMVYRARPQPGFRFRRGTKLSEAPGEIPYWQIGMNAATERNLGKQPIAGIMDELGLKAQDLVAVSTEHLTHKMVARACKGRRLTRNVQCKVRNALNKSADREYSIGDLFTY